MSKQDWYYQHGGVTKGPYTSRQMNDFLITGVISTDTMVGARAADWTAYSRSVLARDSATECNTSARPLDNFCIWAMAGVPVMGAILELMSGWTTWLYYVVLYIVLYRADCARLIEAGYLPLSGWNILLAPVYLWRRGTRVGDNRYYFYTWLAMFILSMIIMPLP